METIHMYLEWTWLILLVQMTQNSCEFEYFKDYGYFWVERLFLGYKFVPFGVYKIEMMWLIEAQLILY